jgi:alginate O-acetyltransferase complex protein AlgI
LTFLAIGIWHGAGWNFALYGLFHGAMVAIERAVRKTWGERGGAAGESHVLWWLLSIPWTFNLAAFARILFRGGSIEGAGEFARALLGSSSDVLPPYLLGFAALACAIALDLTPPGRADAWIRAYCNWPVWLQAGAIVEPDCR